MITTNRRPKIRCAVYTRKSTDEGLDQDFNSLDAQREACAAYIASQKNEGWVLLPQTYDDGGISGGTLNRPGIQKLLADVDAGLVDQIVVYKVDRLTRSLTDFSKLVERLDAAGASFVSVTQSFNTSTSMGRLTLNMLLSFAQFEREVTTERIRDKIAASKAKGLWMGGVLPLGYTKDGRSLAIVEEEAEIVRGIFQSYLDLGDVRGLAEKLEADGVRSKPSLNGKRSGGRPYSRGMLYNMLNNPVYIGKIRHKGKVYEGQHAAIINSHLWDQVQQKLCSTNRQRRKFQSKAGVTTLLHQKLFAPDARPFQLYTRRGKGTMRQYYVLPDSETGKASWRLVSKELDLRVTDLIAHHLRPQGDLALALIRHRPDSIEGITNALKSLRQSTEATLINKVILDHGQISIELSEAALSDALSQVFDDAVLGGGSEAGQAECQNFLTIQCPFQIKKRGLERRLILGADIDTVQNLDETLITNLGQALLWYDEFKSGKSLGAISSEAGVSTYRVKDILHLAFTAPEIKRSILRGAQPPHLTNQRLITTNLPLCWTEQNRLLDLA